MFFLQTITSQREECPDTRIYENLHRCISFFIEWAIGSLPNAIQAYIFYMTESEQFMHLAKSA